MRVMTRDQVKGILDRVLTWPAERQADVAHVVEIMEERDKSDLCLTDEQAAEVRRRMANNRQAFSESKRHSHRLQTKVMENLKTCRIL